MKPLKIRPFVSAGEAFLAPDGSLHKVVLSAWKNSHGTCLRVGETPLRVTPRAGAAPRPPRVVRGVAPCSGRPPVRRLWGQNPTHRPEPRALRRFLHQNRSRRARAFRSCGAAVKTADSPPTAKPKAAAREHQHTLYRALRVVVLALDENYTADWWRTCGMERERLIKISLQYGKRLGVKREHIEEVLDTALSTVFSVPK